MFRTIADRIRRDTDYPARCYTLEIYNRILDGAFYDHLPHGFHQEMNEAQEYVPLRDRRPSVKYGLCRLLVEDAVALLFSEGHFPTPENEDETIREAMAEIVKDLRLNEVMLDATTAGSVGSIALHLRILGQKDGKSYRAFVEVNNTKYLTPTFDLTQPDVLLAITEKYKVLGKDLRAQGYFVESDEDQVWFWFARQWDDASETWFLPWKVNDQEAIPFQIDLSRTIIHELGFVPWVWVRNLPGKLKLLTTANDATAGVAYSDTDGACTFAAAIDAMIEIDYQLSQAGRGLKYSMDPLLMLKEPAAPPDASFTKSPSNALVVSDKGDAKMLEIGGSAFTVVVEYVRHLREMALEAAHGNRADSQKLSTAQSGRAMELMNQSLIWLADRLRVTYGEGALLNLLKMALLAHEKFPLTVNGVAMAKIKPDVVITLRWPAWYSPTAHDRQEMATTLKLHKEAGHLSRETSVKKLAADYDIEDVNAELALIAADQQAELDALKEIATSKISTTV